MSPKTRPKRKPTARTRKKTAAKAESGLGGTDMGVLPIDPAPAATDPPVGEISDPLYAGSPEHRELREIRRLLQRLLEVVGGGG